VSHTIVLEVTQLNLPLITILNGGITPAFELETTYFVCDIEDSETTSNHRIIGCDEYVDSILAGHYGTTSILHQTS
jgi:hypothetical protein